MKQVIVNADDFGINEVVTSEIERMIEAGRVTSTTVMANGEALDEVKRFAALHPEVSYGVHLCLSDLDSLTKSEGLRKAGLTDENGRFIRKAVFRVATLEDKDVQCAIREELNAQIDVVSSLGFTLSHADSHHHVHTIYPLREVFSEVLKDRGITKIRLGADFRTLRQRRHLFVWMRRNKLNNYYKANFTTTYFFYSAAEFLKAGCPIKEGQTIELMCHPGHSGEGYRKEMAMLEKDLLPKDIKLISYNDLY